MQNIPRLLAAGLIMTTVGFGSASATTLFSDDFQGTLSQWAAGSSGQIVNDPLGSGKALDFTRTIGGGDLFQLAAVGSSTGNFHLSFDYLGNCAHGCGGFVGFNYLNGPEVWLAGSDNYPTPTPLVENGTWTQVALDFASATPIVLKLEDYNGTSDGGTPGNAFFRNLVLTDGAVDPAQAPFAVVPEPASAACCLPLWPG